MRKGTGRSRRPQPRVLPRRGTTNRNLQIERTKLAFIDKAESMGLSLRRPKNESEPYDFLVGTGEGAWRVQVKEIQSTRELDDLDLGQPGPNRRIRCRCGKPKHAKVNEIDLLAAYLVPEGDWYIIPVSPKAMANADRSA